MVQFNFRISRTAQRPSVRSYHFGLLYKVFNVYLCFLIFRFRGFSIVIDLQMLSASCSFHSIACGSQATKTE